MYVNNDLFTQLKIKLCKYNHSVNIKQDSTFDSWHMIYSNIVLINTENICNLNHLKLQSICYMD